MDPVSLAGLGLGAASIAFQLFSGCVEGFMLLSTAHNIGRDGATLVCMLNLQELHLTEWARRVGLLSNPPALDNRLNERIVQAVLFELQTLLLDTDKLKNRYRLTLTPELLTTSPAGGGYDAQLTPRILGDVVSDEQRQRILIDARRLPGRPSLPRRLRWAAIDKSRFEEMIEQIRIFLEELERHLDPLHQRDMDSDLHLILQHVIGQNQKMDELIALQHALSPSSVSSEGSPSHDHRSSLASEAIIRSMTLELESVSEGDIERSSDPAIQASGARALDVRYSEILDFKCLGENTQIGTAKYQNIHVLIEWKNLSGNEAPQIQRQLVKRAHNLAVLLSARKHPEFRSLQCIGLARDTEASRLAFVFKIPETAISHPPQLLRGLFRTRPSVTERLRLALTLTTSLQHFHTAGWFHKNLRSENILQFCSDSSNEGGAKSLANPILAGFAFSRQDAPGQVSEQQPSDPQADIYRHPEAMGNPSTRYSADKDIYALGTILTEIGEWQSLQSLVKRQVDVTKTPVRWDQLARVRDFLLTPGHEGGLATLHYRMGTVYARVTRMMLSGEIPGVFTASKDTGFFAPNVLDVAIRELGRCVI
ncbi:MAG: hypothetical protein M1828_004010 [Chrysothrix sp. TS-e1954]|nr:MAG: hypothetical protein M1828_004010 [Chrysothrix sp. TS-e1954]